MHLWTLINLIVTGILIIARYRINRPSFTESMNLDQLMRLGKTIDLLAVLLLVNALSWIVEIVVWIILHVSIHLK